MSKEERQRELATPLARAESAEVNEHILDRQGQANPARFPGMMAASEVVLRVAEECEDSVAQIAHAIRCLRAARGGTSGTSQTAANHLAHPRLKSVTLEDAQLALREGVARAEDAERAAVSTAVQRILESEIQRESLRRCEAAVERRALSKSADKIGVLVQARRVVAASSRLGIQEGHWSTVGRTTIEKMADMMRADNLIANVGSPDRPRMDWKSGRGERS